MPQPTIDTTPADPLKIHPEDLPDIQGFILHGYNMPKSRHFVITIGQLGETLEFLDALTSGSGNLSITSAARWPGEPAWPPYRPAVGRPERAGQRSRMVPP